MQDQAADALDLSHYWMPFEANRRFKSAPIVEEAHIEAHINEIFGILTNALNPLSR